MLKLCLTVILLGCATQINCENLPVFIWGQKTPSFLPALSHLNGEEFVTLVKSQTDKDTLTVVFVENSLSVEDLSQCKLKTETCFQNLRKIEQKTYLSAVEDPVKALSTSIGTQKQKSILLSNEGELSEKLDEAGSERLLFIYLDDAESSEDFAKHDELMNKLYNSISEKRENVIAIYTARHPSFVYSKPLIRKARDTAGKAEGDEVTKNQTVYHDVDNLFWIALSGIKVGVEPEPIIDVNIGTLTVTVQQNATDVHLMGVTLTAGSDVFDMLIELSGGTWFVQKFNYKGRRFYPVGGKISAYDGKSYGCIELTLSDAKTHIRLENVQIQPLFHPDEEHKEITRFADRANDCTGFFSPAIWGALFVVIILLSIMTVGITMMLDIRTMDRFDDPKGKTITINAQE